MKTLGIVFILAACGGGNTHPGGADSAVQSDSRVFMDAPPNVPAMITLAGTATDSSQNSTTPLAGVAVSLKDRTNDSVLATATSDAQGKYSLVVTTGGHVVDAYILATKSGYVDAMAFPGKPFEADSTTADSNLITTNNYSLLGVYTGQQTSNGIIVIEVLDANGTAVKGAAAKCNPMSGSILYSGDNGIPASGMSTNTDGTAFLVNVPPGAAALDVTMSGAAFKNHSVIAKANTFTSTVVTE